jgi:hypothetical protein
MSEITTDREAAAKQLASDAVKVWRHLSPTEKDVYRREAERRIDRGEGIRIHPSEDETDVTAYVGVSMRDALDDIALLVALAEGGRELDKTQMLHVLDLEGPADESEIVEAAQERLYQLPLCVDRTVCFEIVLGTGGPDRRLVVECEHNAVQGHHIRRIVYRYSWSGSAEVELLGDDRETAEEFARRVVPELSE